MAARAQVERYTSIPGKNFARLDFVRANFSIPEKGSVSKEKDLEMMNWHMEFDHIDVDVTGAQKAVVISIAYRDPLTKDLTKKSSGYLTRLVIPGTLPEGKARNLSSGVLD